MEEINVLQCFVHPEKGTYLYGCRKEGTTLYKKTKKMKLFRVTVFWDMDNETSIYGVRANSIDEVFHQYDGGILKDMFEDVIQEKTDKYLYAESDCELTIELIENESEFNLKVYSLDD